MATLHLFIDTNVFLTFYAFANDDLEQLRKITGLIKADKLKLYVPKQLVDEFYRNREGKLAESMKEFTKVSLGKAIPRYMADYPETADLKDAASKWQKARDALVSKAKAEAEAKSLAADTLFAAIIHEAGIIESTPALKSKALDRRLTGNPPGKHNSLGDQINWEALLETVPEGFDLHIVSRDGDFESDLLTGKAKQYLVDEWTEKKKAGLYLHEELRPFLNYSFPDIKLAVDIEKRSAMDSLIHSGFFSNTHSAIEQLLPYIDAFTWSDVDELLTAGLNNSQIKWIGADEDVRSFYRKLQSLFPNKLDAERKAELDAAFPPPDIPAVGGVVGAADDNDPPL